MNTYIRILIALLGLSLVILIHESGHFIACQFYGIAVPLFSVGFGPTLFGAFCGTTFFQIALLPIGGYVSIDQHELLLQPYSVKAAILLAGIALNIACAYLIRLYIALRKKNVSEMLKTISDAHGGIMGPIGIISMIQYSLQLGFDYFFLMMGGLSMSIGLFNLLPIPFLDGGQLLLYTIETITGPLSEYTHEIIQFICMALFIVIIGLISYSDIKKL